MARMDALCCRADHIGAAKKEWDASHAVLSGRLPHLVSFCASPHLARASLLWYPRALSPTLYAAGSGAAVCCRMPLPRRKPCTWTHNTSVPLPTWLVYIPERG